MTSPRTCTKHGSMMSRSEFWVIMGILFLALITAAGWATRSFASVDRINAVEARQDRTEEFLMRIDANVLELIKQGRDQR